MSESYVLQADYVIKLMISLSSVSLISSVFVVVIYFSNKKKLVNFSFTLMLCIGLSELMNSLAHIFSFNLLGQEGNDPRNKDLCKAQRFILLATDLCTMTFISLLSYWIYQRLKFNNYTLESNKKKVITFSFIIPVIISSIFCIIYQDEKKGAVSYSIYSPQCWLGRENQVLSSIYYLIYSLVNIYLIFIIFQFRRFIKKEIENETSDKAELLLSWEKMYKYSFINVMNWTIVFFQRVFEMRIGHLLEPKNSLRIAAFLMVTYVIFMSLRGFFFFLIFLDSTKVKDLIDNLYAQIKAIVGLPEETRTTLSKNELPQDEEEDDKNEKSRTSTEYVSLDK